MSCETCFCFLYDYDDVPWKQVLFLWSSFDVEWHVANVCIITKWVAFIIYNCYARKGIGFVTIDEGKNVNSRKTHDEIKREMNFHPVKLYTLNIISIEWLLPPWHPPTYLKCFGSYILRVMMGISYTLFWVLLFHRRRVFKKYPWIEMLSYESY